MESNGLNLGEQFRRKAQFGREISREFEKENNRLETELLHLRSNLNDLRSHHETLLLAVQEGNLSFPCIRFSLTKRCNSDFGGLYFLAP